MNTNNRNSLIRGIGSTLFLCFLWAGIAITAGWSSTALMGGLMAIIVGWGFGGYETIPVQHRGVEKTLGTRKMDEKKQPREGPYWTPPWKKIDIVSEQVWTHNVPPLEALTKKTEEEKAVEMITDVKVRLRIVNPALYFNLKNPEKEIIELIDSKCDEANFEYITNRAYSQCREAKGEIQTEIKKEMQEIDKDKPEISIKSEYGVEVLEIDVRTVLPRKDIREGLAQDKLQEIKVDRLTKSMDDIQKAAGDDKIDSKTLTNIAQVTLGIVKKDISEKKISFDLGHDTIEAGKNLANILLNRETKQPKGDG